MKTAKKLFYVCIEIIYIILCMIYIETLSLGLHTHTHGERREQTIKSVVDFRLSDINIFICIVQIVHRKSADSLYSSLKIYLWLESNRVKLRPKN